MGLFLGVQPPNMAWLMVEPFIGFLLLFWCEFTRLPGVLMGDTLRWSLFLCHVSHPLPWPRTGSSLRGRVTLGRSAMKG